jgi:hypothetical protein
MLDRLIVNINRIVFIREAVQTEYVSLTPLGRGKAEERVQIA